jgi:hypothetical protein
MKEELIGFDVAVLAKAKGFDAGVNNTFSKALFKGKNPDWEGVFEKGAVFENGGFYHRNNDEAADDSNNKWSIYARPSQSLLQRWLRDKQTDITIPTDWGLEGRSYISSLSYVNTANEVDIWIRKNKGLSVQYKTHEEALEVALLQGLKLLPDAS